MGEIGAGVRAAEEAVDKAHQATDIAAEKFIGARDILGMLLATTRRAEATAAVEALTAAVARAEAAAAHAAEVTTLLDEWLVDAGLPRRAPSSTEGATRGGSVPVPETVRRVATGMRPWRDGERTIARTFVHDEDEPVKRQSQQDITAAAGLKLPYAAAWVVTDHVEGHVAADMRRPDAPHSMTLVINNEPCPGKMGCDAVLRHIIPKDSTVTVYVIGEDGPRWYGTYHGTGEGIA